MSVSIKKICEILEEAEVNLANKLESAWIPSFDASIDGEYLFIFGELCGYVVKRSITVLYLDRMKEPCEYIRDNIDLMVERLYSAHVEEKE